MFEEEFVIFVVWYVVDDCYCCVDVIGDYLCEYFDCIFDVFVWDDVV